MTIKTKSHIFRLLLELLLLAVLLILVQYFAQIWPSAAPTQRGFFCDDPSIQYPFRESTVTHTWLMILGLYLPLTLIIIIEISRYFVVKFQRKSKENNCCITTLPGEGRGGGEQLVLQLYLAICSFLLGYSCERLFKAVGKFTIGRLRPHFLAVCQPQMPDGTTCADVINQGRYIAEYTCVGLNSTAAMLRNLHVSFPSGHSSMISYGMVFLALYLQRNLAGHVGRVFKPILQLVCLLVAWFVALSRVMDYKHHWSDVLAGALLGSAIAIFMFFMRYWAYVGEAESTVVQEHNLKCCCGSNSVSNAVLSEVISEKSEGAVSHSTQKIISEKSENEKSQAG